MLGGSMTKYQYYMDWSDECIKRATSYMHSGDMDLAEFYKNAAEGFKNKALSTKIEGA